MQNSYFRVNDGSVIQEIHWNLLPLSLVKDTHTKKLINNVAEFLFNF